MLPRAVHFREATVREAIEYLKKLSSGLRSDSLGVNLVMSVGPEPPPPFSLKLENVNYLKALDEICAKAGLFWKIGNRAIVVGPREYVKNSAG